MTQPILSIITIVYNGEDYIEETINSVLSQKNKLIEYIIVDGASSDGTMKIVNSKAECIDYIISEKDNGIYNAMNKGLKICSGKYVTFLNCGDYFESNALNYLTKFLVTIDFSIVYFDINFIEYFDNEVFKKRQIANHKLLTIGMSIFHPSTVVMRDLYLKEGGFSEDYKLAADYDLFLKYFLEDIDFFYLPYSFVNFRLGGISTNSFFLSLKENVLIRLNRLNIIDALKYLLIKIITHFYFRSRQKIFILLFGNKKFVLKRRAILENE